MLHQSGTTLHAQTDLAKRCKPPSNFLGNMGTVVAMIVSVFALPAGCVSSTMTGSSFPGNFGYGILASIISTAIVIGIFIVLSRVTGFSARHSQKMKDWENSTMCVDCGNVMVSD